MCIQEDTQSRTVHFEENNTSLCLFDIPSHTHIDYSPSPQLCDPNIVALTTSQGRDLIHREVACHVLGAH